MSTKNFCDECFREVDWHHRVSLSVSIRHPLRDLEFCTECFARHWKPGSKKFSLRRKKIDPIDRLRQRV